MNIFTRFWNYFKGVKPTEVVNNVSNAIAVGNAVLSVYHFSKKKIKGLKKKKAKKIRKISRKSRRNNRKGKK